MFCSTISFFFPSRVLHFGQHALSPDVSGHWLCSDSEAGAGHGTAVRTPGLCCLAAVSMVSHSTTAHRPHQASQPPSPLGLTCTGPGHACRIPRGKLWCTDRSGHHTSWDHWWPAWDTWVSSQWVWPVLGRHQRHSSLPAGLVSPSFPVQWWRWHRAPHKDQAVLLHCSFWSREQQAEPTVGCPPGVKKILKPQKEVKPFLERGNAEEVLHAPAARELWRAAEIPRCVSSRWGRRGSTAHSRKKQLAGSWGTEEELLGPCWHQGRGQVTGSVPQDMENGTGREDSSPLPVPNTQRGAERDV